MTTEPMCRRCGKNPIFDISDSLCESCCFEVDASPQIHTAGDTEVVDIYRDGVLVSRTERHPDGSQRVQSWSDPPTDVRGIMTYVENTKDG